ncbi:hypothetical protein [Devosia sp. MC521]|uniref:hypothetical protein n=1 Tax=Devosia sp. MC521 TaxID=2759954 RepID=UPI0015FD19E6|nr:hypothetical protein [Devosia sp. MC521]MBJ6987579.1 hypothetical protein [Devosia sp. MC521]QMW61931.1 hypothetical protein H4N61_13325 [Devosia sp. MC521]
MGLIAPLAALLGLEVENIADKAKAAAIVYGLLGLFSTIAIVFLLVAAYLALADLFSPLMAALLLAGLFVLLAVALLLGAQIGKNQQKRKVAQRRRSSETGAFITTAALTAVPMILRAPMAAKLALPAAIIGTLALLRNRE